MDMRDGCEVVSSNNSSSVRTHCLKTQELRKSLTDLARFKGRRTAALSNKTKERGRLYLLEVYPYLRRGKWKNSLEKHIEKSTFSTADRDSNLEPPVINNIIYCESSAIDHAATKES
uniref:Uncharacterized protein n=1 Tax=Timema cristinae TaxID=61476 RepID=A0A7R9H454_TIMCR|nr:unnamed protein product [Timema cristinae]